MLQLHLKGKAAGCAIIGNWVRQWTTEHSEFGDHLYQPDEGQIGQMMYAMQKLC